ncbi:hypothetical protein BDR04DRAFT_464404 [Suillus decipiens]|nr:hypothetical protein BDR04DRAFT_464404 [Suillus decipiens]
MIKIQVLVCFIHFQQVCIFSASCVSTLKLHAFPHDVPGRVFHPFRAAMLESDEPEREEKTMTREAKHEGKKLRNVVRAQA